MKEIFLKKYIFIKNNLSILILLPTIIGGIWQLLELSTISTSFIRFFSLSQLVPDGLLILFIFIVLYLSYKFNIAIFGKNNFKVEFNEKPLPLSNGIILVVLILLTFWFAFLPEMKHIYEVKHIKIYEFFFIIFAIINIGGVFLVGIFRIIINLVYRNKERIQILLIKLKSKKNVQETFIRLLSSISFIMIAFLLKFILIDLHPYMVNFRKEILYPNTLINKQILDNDIKKRYNLKNSPVLEYFNDKYFFYRIKDSTKNDRVLIVEFSDLTKHDFKSR